VDDIKLEHLKVTPGRAVDAGVVEALVKSIQEIGLMHPIAVDADTCQVLAGIHRVEAFRRLGRKTIPAIVHHLDALRCRLARLDENLVRNDGTALERAKALGERQEIYESLHPETKKGGDPKRHDGGLAPGFAKDTSAATGIADRTIQRHTQVARKIDPEAEKEIAETVVADSITDLEQLVRLEPTEQRKVAKRAAETGSVKRAIKDLRREERLEEVKRYVPPQGEYPVIVADPAWPYEDQLDGSEAVRGGTPYPQASILEICNQVPPAAKDCVLFLWCTNQHLIDLSYPVQRVLMSWGFESKALLTWKKPRMGLGRYVRNITEQCVIAVRGNPVLDLPSATSWLEAPAGEHSEKPDAFYELAAKLCPAEPRLEMNARKPREGWVTSGSELEGKHAEEQTDGERGGGVSDQREAEGRQEGGRRGKRTVRYPDAARRGAPGVRPAGDSQGGAHGVPGERDVAPLVKGQWRRGKGTAHFYEDGHQDWGSTCGRPFDGSVAIDKPPPAQQCMTCKDYVERQEAYRAKQARRSPAADDDGSRCGIRERGRGDPCILDEGHDPDQLQPLHSTGTRTWLEPKPKFRKCAAPHCKVKTTSKLCDQHSAMAYLEKRKKEETSKSKALKRKGRRS